MTLRDALDNADVWWRDPAERALAWWAETGQPFTVDDLRNLGVSGPVGGAHRQGSADCADPWRRAVRLHGGRTLHRGATSETGGMPPSCERESGHCRPEWLTPAPLGFSGGVGVSSRRGSASRDHFPGGPAALHVDPSEVIKTIASGASAA